MSQQSMPRIGPANAEIVMFNKGGRDFRYERLQRGEETPREFFYGLFDLQKAGLSAAMLSSSGRAPGAFGAAADAVELSVHADQQFRGPPAVGAAAPCRCRQGQGSDQLY